MVFFFLVLFLELDLSGNHQMVTTDYDERHPGPDLRCTLGSTTQSNPTENTEKAHRATDIPVYMDVSARNHQKSNANLNVG